MKTLFLLLMTSLVLFSCEGKDGDWDPMIWKSNDVSNINKNKSNIEISQAGKSYVFTCENYKYFWVYAIRENGKQMGDDWKIQCKLPPKTKRFCPLVLK